MHGGHTHATAPQVSAARRSRAAIPRPWPCAVRCRPRETRPASTGPSPHPDAVQHQCRARPPAFARTPTGLGLGISPRCLFPRPRPAPATRCTPPGGAAIDWPFYSKLASARAQVPRANGECRWPIRQWLSLGVSRGDRQEVVAPATVTCWPSTARGRAQSRPPRPPTGIPAVARRAAQACLAALDKCSLTICRLASGRTAGAGAAASNLRTGTQLGGQLDPKRAAHTTDYEMTLATVEPNGSPVTPTGDTFDSRIARRARITE